jgi:two-component system, NtrC family, sensor kinase
MSSKKHLILWATDKPLTQKDIFEKAPFASCELIEVQSPEFALQFMRAHNCSVLLASSSFGADFFKVAQEVAPTVSQILFLESDSRDIADIVNTGFVQSIIRPEASREELSTFIHRALVEAELTQTRLEMRRESRRQNRELEALNQSLEKIVEDRTSHIESAKTEEEHKLSKVRSLIRVIKELGAASIFEDLLQVMRRELRKITKVGDFILVLQIQPESTVIYSFQSGNFVRSESYKGLQIPTTFELDSKGMRTFLANHFGRPFIKTAIVPLDTKSTQNSSQTQVRAAICLENSSSEEGSKTLIEFFSDYQQSFSMAVDRILLESEHTEIAFRWEKTFDSLHNPIAIIDLEYEVLRANRNFADRTAKKKCFESFADSDGPCEGCPVQLALEQAEPKTGVIHKSGRIFEVHSYPINLEAGRPTNVVNHYVDITESRELYIRMLQAEKMGALGLLAGNIAHELNNPLTGLRSLAQVLLKQIPGDLPIHADLKEIEGAAARSQKIIKHLKEFSSKEGSEKEKISLDEIVERTMPLLKSLLRSHRMNLDLQTKDQFVEVEPQMIQQVVFNLINNACQAMKVPGTLTVSTHFNTHSGQAELFVKDTGPGIPPELAKKIFEPFFTTKKEGSGTGLGLSLAKEIIENHHGSISLKSEIGTGTEFQISLPVVGSP